MPSDSNSGCGLPVITFTSKWKMFLKMKINQAYPLPVLTYFLELNNENINKGVFGVKTKNICFLRFFPIDIVNLTSIF